MKCLMCSGEFTPRKNHKTCSPECSALRKRHRDLGWRINHPERWRTIQYRYREPIHRAVRALFNPRNYA